MIEDYDRWAEQFGSSIDVLSQPHGWRVCGSPQFCSDAVQLLRDAAIFGFDAAWLCLGEQSLQLASC
jgi:hypothetical protein